MHGLAEAIEAAEGPRPTELRSEHPKGARPDHASTPERGAMVAAHQTRQSEHAEAIGVQQRCRLEFVGTRQFAAAKPLQGGQQRFQASDGARDVTDDSSVTCDDWHETAVLRPSAGTVLPGSA